MRNHQQIIEAGRYPLGVLPKRLPHQAFEPVADNGIAAGFAYGNAQPGIFTIIPGHIERQHPIAQTPTASHDGFELTVADKPFLFRKGKPFHNTVLRIAFFSHDAQRVPFLSTLLSASFELYSLSSPENLDVDPLSDLGSIENSDRHAHRLASVWPELRHRVGDLRTADLDALPLLF